MKYLGKLNGSNYYIKPDGPDYDGIHNPLDDDNQWILLGFGYIGDEHIAGIAGLQEWVEDRLGHELPGGSLEDLQFDCESSGVDEADFFDKVAARLNRAGVLMVPVSKYEHDSIELSTGIAYGWDAGVCGVAVAFKSDLRKEYKRKRVTPLIKNIAGDNLAIELRHINDDNNGGLLWAWKDPDTAAEDDLGGIYCSDYDAAPDKLNFVADLF